MTNTRYKTMFTKEIDTINWIDNFENEKIFWDIGANVGIYSIYYAKKILIIKYIALNLQFSI